MGCVGRVYLQGSEKTNTDSTAKEQVIGETQTVSTCITRTSTKPAGRPVDFLCWHVSAKYGFESVGNQLRSPGSGLIYTGKTWKAKCRVSPGTRFLWTCPYWYRSRIRFLLAGKRVGVNSTVLLGGIWTSTRSRSHFSPSACFFGKPNSWNSEALPNHLYLSSESRQTWGNSGADSFCWCKVEEPAAFSLGGMSCMSRQPRGLWTTMDPKWAPEFAAQGPRVC